MQNLSKLLISFIISLTFLALQSMAQAAEIAYVWANKPTAAVYTPSTHYTYNDGQRVEITRVSRGVYQVELGRVAGVGATVHTEIYGNKPGYCNVWSWNNNVANVHCFDHAGAPADRRYTLFSIKGENADKARLGYAWLHSPTTSSYIATPRYSFGSANRQVTRYGTGWYNIHLTHISHFPLFATVTGYQTDARCRRTTVVNGQYVEFICSRPDGPDRSSKDAQATVLMLYKGFDRLSLAVNIDPQGLILTPSKASDDSPQSISRLSTGRYLVRVGPEASVGGIVMVTSLLSFANCRAEFWGGGDVIVLCLNGTTPEDATFGVAAFSSNSLKKD